MSEEEDSMNYAKPIIQTHESCIVDISNQSYALYEMDWISIHDYMDKAHAHPLYSLCPTSYVSQSCLELRISWFLLLHHLDDDIQRLVLDIIIEGMIVVYNLCRVH